MIIGQLSGKTRVYLFLDYNYNLISCFLDYIKLLAGNMRYDIERKKRVTIEL
jgi:hypothetical protein